jgi:uncharacterized SAM-binding protein YcdF (DUF218 family)
VDQQSRADLDLLGAFLARRDVASLAPEAAPAADVLVLCGSAVLAAIGTAADAFHAGVAGHVLVSGGVGHSTPYLLEALRHHPAYDDVPTAARSESAVIAEILRRHHGVPGSAIQLDERSTNCGENAAYSVEILRRDTPTPRTVLLLQDPTMQRRTHESFRRSLRALGDVRLVSFAPFVPSVAGPTQQVLDAGGRPVWSLERYTVLVLGEVRRLYDDEHGYGPRGAGFIDHVEIPAEILDAYGRLAVTRPGSVREPWRP